IAEIESHDPPPPAVNHDPCCFSVNYAGTDPSLPCRVFESRYDEIARRMPVEVQDDFDSLSERPIQCRERTEEFSNGLVSSGERGFVAHALVYLKHPLCWPAFQRVLS